MKLIIAGSRTLNPASELIGALLYWQFDLSPKEIVSGGARGVDAAGEYFALYYNTDGLPITKFYADWETYGKAAGHIRNKQMAEYADALLLIWDGESKGSANMKTNMQKLNKPVYEIIIKKPLDKQEEL